MKLTKYFLPLFILLFWAKPSEAQITSYSLTVFEPLPIVELGVFFNSNSLSGQPRVFHVQMVPEGIPVYIVGRFKWKETPTSSFVEVASFRTNVFPSKSFFNNEIGNSDITIEESNTVSSEITKLREYGKPVGEVEMFFELYNATGSLIMGGFANPQTYKLAFLNPTQTLSVRLPMNFSVQEIGNILAEWDPVPGVLNYNVKARIKTSTNISDEDILESGLPLIENVSVGNQTTVNLRNLMSREPDFGDTIALRIEATIPSPGGDIRFFSNPIRFYINNPLGNDGQLALNRLMTLFSFFPNNVANQLMTFFSQGLLSITNIEGDGGSMSLIQLEELLNSLMSNPDRLINITVTQ